MKTPPIIFLVGCIAGCIALSACGEGEDSPSDDARARLQQALGLGDAPGAGDRLGSGPGAGNGLGSAPGVGNGLGAVPGAGDQLGSGPGAGDGLGQAASGDAEDPRAGDGGRGPSGGEEGSFCEVYIGRLVECGFFSAGEGRENLPACEDGVAESPGAVAPLRRCLSLSCNAFAECVSGDQ